MKKVTALLLGFLLLVSSCGTGSDSDSADETAPTTTSEQQAPASAPLDELGEPVGEIMEGWTAVTDETVFGTHGRIGQILEGGPGLLAFGTDCASDPAGECVIAVWGSVDGTEWERLASIDASLDAELTDIDAQQFRVTPGGPGFVATSTTCVDAYSVGCGPVVWTSPNGTDWDRVPIDESVFPRCGALPDDPDGGPGVQEACQTSIDHLVALPDGGVFAVAGEMAEWGDTYVAWASTDGRDWRIVDEAFNPFGADADDITIDHFVAAGPGLIATGGVYIHEPITVPHYGLRLIDTDDDAVEVDGIEPEGPAHDAGLEVGDIVVAVDGAPVPDMCACPKRLPGAHQAGDTITVTIVRDGERLDLEMTLGTETLEGSGRSVVATSTDGTEWTPVPGALEAGLDGGFVSIGSWAGGVAATADVCDGLGWCGSIFLTSPDGVTWLRLTDPPAFGELFPFLDDGLLMVHQSDEETDQTQTLLATSPDGSDWTLYVADPELFPDETDISDAIVHNERLIAVGADWPDGELGRPQPRVWIYETPTWAK